MFDESGSARFFVKRGDIAAVEDDRARDRLDQPKQRPAQRGLAGAGLADNTDRLAFADEMSMPYSTTGATLRRANIAAGLPYATTSPRATNKSSAIACLCYARPRARAFHSPLAR